MAATGVGELLRKQLPDAPPAWLVAEVFGTYVLGPSYAFAALMLELDPRVAADQARARTILHTLARMDRNDDQGRFTALADSLGEEWSHAVSAAAPGAAEDSPSTAPDEELDRAFAAVEGACRKASYLAEDRWSDVEELSHALSGEGEGPPLKNVDVRDLTNAMWLARWNAPDAVERIEARAETNTSHSGVGAAVTRTTGA